jgi:hypothetical protein
MKNDNLFSYKPQNPNEKVWRVCPDPKSEFIVLEIREKQEKRNTSQLLILDSQKRKVLGTAEMEATQTLLNFFDKTILLSEIDFQNEMPLAKGLQALNMGFEMIWELEEVSYYGIIEQETQNQIQSQDTAKVAFSLQSNYYSVPLNFSKEESQTEIEAREENYDNLNSKVRQYFYSTNEYSTNHINYKDISDFIFEKTNHKARESIFYTENDNYLICSYLVENDNYLFLTDKKGNLKIHFLIKNVDKEDTKNPQELILMENKILWTDENEFYLLSI